MSSADTWGFRLKLAITIVFGSFLAMLLVAGVGGNSGVSQAIVGLLLLPLSFAALSVPVLVWLDARAIRREGDWSPNPWIWGLGSFVYGIPLLLYFALRKHHLGRLGAPLWEGSPTSSWGLTDSVSGNPSSGADASESTGSDTWAFRLKWATAILLGSLLIGAGTPDTSSINGFAAVVGLGSYVATVVLMWLDASTLRNHGEWAPRRWFWIPTTAVLFGLPALAYFSRRSSRAGSTGPPLLGNWRESFESMTESTRTDSSPRQRLRREGHSLLERAEQLKREGQYVQAEEAFDEAADTFRSLEAFLEKEIGVLPHETDVASKIAEAERGAEDCWMQVLTDKVETAEEHLAAQDYRRAKRELEQADSVLEARSFDHYDTSSLERRVRNGLETVD